MVYSHGTEPAYNSGMTSLVIVTLAYIAAVEAIMAQIKESK